MSKTYMYWSIGCDRYIVARYTDKPRKGEKPYQEYLVNLKAFHCDCKGFQVRKICKHIKDIIAALYDGGRSIQKEDCIDFDTFFAIAKRKEFMTNKNFK